MSTAKAEFLAAYKSHAACLGAGAEQHQGWMNRPGGTNWLELLGQDEPAQLCSLAGVGWMNQRIMIASHFPKAWLFLIAVILALAIESASSRDLKRGDNPPLLQATTLLQAPPGASMDAKSLHGKVVVLEFWATWCGPCVAAFPHLNELADKFKGQPVQFIAITAEDEATIRPFLSKRPIHTWVALDTDRAMNNAYGIRSIPHTVVLGKDGKIAAITYPTMLTDKHIHDLLAGKKIDLSEPGKGEETVANKNGAKKPPLFQVLVRPSDYTNSSCGWGNGRLNARGYTVRDMLPLAFDASLSRILTNAPLPEGKFDFNITQPRRADESIGPLLQQALKSAFGLTGSRETNDVEVLLLKVKVPDAAGLVVSPTPSGSFRYGPGDIEGMNVSMTAMAAALENCLKKPVIDETGLTNLYDVTLKWDQKSADESNSEGLLKALREQLGLDLEPATRPIGMVRIEQAKDWKPVLDTGQTAH
jgi:uncharacterized protein (TIGR03435 family)